jgi:VIT1/CCC1 family predicted Fe2+/Mn2+ transporter
MQNDVSSATLNKLRAAVLGANDGIVSTASIVVGVAGASSSANAVFIAGMAGLVAGALSMAVGEYVSVSSQRDSERATLDREQQKITHNPKEQEKELEETYIQKGLQPKTAQQVARELMKHDPLKAHAEAEYNLQPDALTNPLHAAIASGLSFTAGAILPLLSVTLSPEKWRVIATFIAVGFALFITGSLSAMVGGASKKQAVVRVVIGGFLAMAITFGVGKLLGTNIM